MYILIQLIIGAVLFLASPLLSACDEGVTEVPRTMDWAGIGVTARENHLPIMLVFSADGCYYCERLKGELLNPLLKKGTLQQAVLVREIDINVGGKMNDFDGVSVRSRIFVDRYQVFATPTVVLVDPQGVPLSDPIVGYDEVGEYAVRLQEAITNAQIHLEKGATLAGGLAALR